MDDTAAADSRSRPLQGRVALVTGGSRGLGRQLCGLLASAGADVAFTYRMRADEAERTSALIRSEGVRDAAIAASVESSDDNERSVAEVSSTLGSIDILINNAGIVSRGALVADTAPDEFERLMRVHAFGPAQLCRLVIPGMRAAGQGDIVMISSVAAVEFEARAAPYTMAKCAQEALARTLAAEERASGIRVNIVAPGLIDTDMGRRLVQARPDDFGDGSSSPEQVATVVLELLRAANTTGVRFAIESGEVTRADMTLPSLQH